PTEHFDFFLYGQFMKFIQRGAVRVNSTAGSRNFANVAFRNPDGTIVLVVVNPTAQRKLFTLAWDGRTVMVALTARSVATLVWAAGKP
ncbi:MAG: glycosyl hydrolase, partial [Verrucomicrobia bacterium]|nr:glycosyl hydrolase [Verrucomicrobiota bacterium]